MKACDMVYETGSSLYRRCKDSLQHAVYVDLINDNVFSPFDVGTRFSVTSAETTRSPRITNPVLDGLQAK